MMGLGAVVYGVDRAEADTEYTAIAAASERNDKDHWMRAGRACQRFALQATALGLKHAFVNQPVEVPSVRSQLAAYLGLGTRRPDLLMRFGYGPKLPRSLRRPVEHVLIGT